MSPCPSVCAFNMPTRAPAICAGVRAHKRAREQQRCRQFRVVHRMRHHAPQDDPGHQRSQLGARVRQPPAPFQMSGSSKKPAADSGSAIRYTDPKPGWLFTSKAGNNRAAITAACVISAVNWNVPSGMASDIESCSMRPLMNARIDVPSTGRHSTDNAPLNTGAENSSSMGLALRRGTGGRTPRKRRTAARPPAA